MNLIPIYAILSILQVFIMPLLEENMEYLCSVQVTPSADTVQVTPSLPCPQAWQINDNFLASSCGFPHTTKTNQPQQKQQQQKKYRGKGRVYTENTEDIYEMKRYHRTSGKASH